jgi:hypothetical protein
LSFEKNIISFFEVLKSTNSGKIWAGLSFEKYINKLFEVLKALIVGKFGRG